MRYVPTLILAASILVGCERGAEQAVGRYSVVSGSDGRLVRVDTKTGEVTPVDIARTKLVVNELYQSEDGQLLRYVGKGKLEPRRPLSKFLEDHP
jgi:hypothetical protein